MKSMNIKIVNVNFKVKVTYILRHNKENARTRIVSSFLKYKQMKMILI